MIESPMNYDPRGGGFYDSDGSITVLWGNCELVYSARGNARGPIFSTFMTCI